MRRAARLPRSTSGWAASATPPPRRVPHCVARSAQRTVPRWISLASMGASELAPSAKPVLLLDVMDTIVYDPFFQDMPVHFGMSFKELLAQKHPSAWLEFECGDIDEDQLFAKFFADGRRVDGGALKDMLVSKYRWLPGMEPLLARLVAAGYRLHACSNYPTWYRLIEAKLAPSRYLSWTFVSCEGAMKGHRKPAREAYEACIEELQLQPADLIFVDDRKVNVEGARAAGMHGILFEGADALEQELLRKGLSF